MRITRYDPWNIINQMDDLLNMSFRGSDDSNISTSQWRPAIDIREDKEQFIIEADLPGINKNDIEVSMDNRSLTIKGERKSENKVDEGNYSRTERFYGSFHRQFTLPDTVDADNIHADYTNGVLKLCIPKKEVAKPKRITINSNADNNLLEHKEYQA